MKIRDDLRSSGEQQTRLAETIVPRQRGLMAASFGRLRLRSTPYLFLLPAFVLYCTFVVYPMIYSFAISLTSWDGLAPVKVFVGLANYGRIFRDPIAQLAIENNLIWTAATLIIPTTLGLLLAVALNQRIAGTTIFRSIFYAPGILPLVAVASIWGWMYNPQYGAVNALLGAVGLRGLEHGWLADFNTALPATIATAIWQSIGFPMLLYLAGLQGIPNEQYEAARIDGAGALQRFRYITLPGLHETHVVVITLAIIGSFKVFDIIYAMTYGGPGQATQVLATWMYFNTFQYYHAGYGSALAWTIAIVSLVVTIPYIRLMARRGANNG